MFPSLLERCELNNAFSTKLLDYIRNTQKVMLSLWGGIKNLNSCKCNEVFHIKQFHIAVEISRDFPFQ